MFSNRRIAAFAACLSIAAVIPVATQAEQPEKVTICHVSGNSNDVFSNAWIPNVVLPYIWVFGHKIEVNANALDAHLAHGDSIEEHPRPPGPFASGFWWSREEIEAFPIFGPFFTQLFADGHFPNTDCGIRYLNTSVPPFVNP